MGKRTDAGLERVHRGKPHRYGTGGRLGHMADAGRISLSGLQKADFTKYAESQKKGMAQSCHVPVEKVRVISRDEYEENTD